MKLIRKRVLLKAFAVFFLLEIVTSTVAPAVSWALTSGPTMPELSSFIQASNDQMVNRFTGNFGYQIPLLEISSPEGSYPINLSYQAGIKLGQEATFVGLGWNLSPGAISRFSNGHPDDYAGAGYSVHDTWEGGASYKEGFGLQLSGVGLWYESNWSTHSPDKARFVNFGGLAFDERSPDVSFNTFGFGMQFSMKTKKIVGVQGGFSVSSGGGASGGMTGSTGIGWDSNSFATSASRGVYLSNLVSTVQSEIVESKDYFVYRYQKTRYWIDETEESSVYGALQAHYVPTTIPEDYSFDRSLSGEVIPNAYSVADQLVSKDDYEFWTGPSVLAYDQYSVSGQGMVGSIEPVALDNPVLFDRKKERVKFRSTEYDITSNTAGRSFKRKFFRFKGDFSNSYRVSNVANYGMSGGGSSSPVSLDYGANGLGYTQAIVDNDGFNAQTMELAGSKRVQYFENQEITNGAAKGKGFINYVRTVNRTAFEFTSPRQSSYYDITKQIGGYSITDANGVTYHYALPAYTRGHTQFSTKLDAAGKKVERRISNPHPYAYTWLLTSVTGPDFVDRNDNGFADQGDWGYWTNFVYAQTTNYAYRLPAEANQYIIGIDGSKSYSAGGRENYYLDAIYSRTQTAFFIKDIRRDGKAINPNVTSGFGVESHTQSFSAPSYKLNRIVLMDNSNLSETNVLSVIESVANQASVDIVKGGEYRIYNSGIITQADADLYFPSRSAHILRQIDFTYDYSLCPQTANSLDIDYANLTANWNVDRGRLTLTSLQFKGRGGVGYLPEYRFNYEEDKTVEFRGLVDGQYDNKTVHVLTSAYNDLKDGDIVKFEFGGTHYGLVVKADGGLVIRLVSDTQFSAGARGYANFKTTKNPPYSRDLYDWWGYYKPDFVKAVDAKTNNDLYRQTTEVSANAVDVWSLRSVLDPFGEEVKFRYSSNEYNVVGTGKSRILNLSNVTNVTYGNISTEYSSQEHLTSYTGGSLKYIKFYLAESELLSNSFLKDVRASLQVGALVDIVSLTRLYNQSTWLNRQTIGGGASNYVVPLKGKVKIEEVGSNYIMVSDPNGLFSSHQGGPVTRHVHYFSYITLPESTSYGDGVRIASIISKNWLAATEEVSYTFEQGVTAAEPSQYSSLCSEKFVYDDWNVIEPTDDDVELYKREYQAGFSKLKVLEGLVPGPGVHYKSCLVRKYIDGIQADNEERYEFQVFDKDMIDISSQYSSTAGFSNFEAELRTLQIRDMSSSVGNVIWTGVYSTKNGDFLRGNTFNYTSNPSQFSYQGVLEQVYNEHRVIHPRLGGKDLHRGTVTVMSTYPNILTGVVERDDHRGISSMTSNYAFDFYSGQVTKQISKDSYGNAYLTEMVPAYRKYNGMTLGMKGGANMLSQTASQTVFKTEGNAPDKVALVSASVQTWSNQVNQKIPWGSVAGSGTNRWRPHRSYSFVGNDDVQLVNGIYPAASFTEFDAWGKDDVPLSAWQLNGEVNYYDVYSHIFESVDMNGNFAAVKMDPYHRLVMASVTNAGYDEFVSTGFEWLPNGWTNDADWSLGGAEVTSSVKHTGGCSVALGAGETGLSSRVVIQSKTDPNANDGAGKFRNYPRSIRISFWVHVASGTPEIEVSDRTTVDNPNLIAFNASNMKKAGSWYLCERDVPVTFDNFTGLPQNPFIFSVKNTGSTTVFIDDFRIHPVDAPLMSYAYSEQGELTFTLDNNNLYTRFVYDEDGRLTEVWRESLKSPMGSVKVSEKTYRYKNQAD